MKNEELLKGLSPRALEVVREMECTSSSEELYELYDELAFYCNDKEVKKSKRIFKQLKYFS